MLPQQGDIVLIPIPFTDLSSHKRRPVIVVSNDDYHRTTTDMVVVAMTSNPTPFEYSFALDSADFVNGRLNRPGTVRVDKVYTLSQSLIVAKFWPRQYALAGEDQRFACHARRLGQIGRHSAVTAASRCCPW
jgi:mRNA interferase MazF